MARCAAAARSRRPHSEARCQTPPLPPCCARRGLELLSDTRLVQPCPSLDLVLGPDVDHVGATLFARLAPAAAAAGARAAALRPGELTARLGPGVPLGVPPGAPAAALLQPDAGVLLAADAVGAARVLAARAGAQVKVGAGAVAGLPAATLPLR
jgi:hypothetical protein